MTSSRGRTVVGIVVGSLLPMWLAGCSSPSGPSLPLSVVIETPAIVYRYTPGDSVRTDWQQAFHEWATRELGVTPRQQITYNKYLSRAHMGQITGNGNTNGFAEPATYTIHTLWSIDNHEVVHLYTSAFGSPVALLNEGIAVAHQTDPVRGDLVPRWSGQAVHEIAARARREGTLVPIDRMVETRSFRNLDPNFTYPVAGSFVRFMIDRFGLDSMKQLFARGNPNDSLDTVRRAVLEVYGRSLGEIEQQWLAFLDRG